MMEKKREGNDKFRGTRKKVRERVRKERETERERERE